VAKSVNKVLLLGYVGKAPEIRSTKSGTVAASLSLATAKRQKDRQGNWTFSTEWHNLVAYGRTAEVVRDYVNKGTRLFIQGKIQTRSWIDLDSGQKRYRTEILIFDLTRLGGDRGENPGSGCGNRISESRRNMSESERQQQAMDERYGDEQLSPDEIPF